MSRPLSSSACSNLACKVKSLSLTRVVTSLKFMFELDLMGKPKSLSLAWLDN